MFWRILCQRSSCGSSCEILDAKLSNFDQRTYPVTIRDRRGNQLHCAWSVASGHKVGRSWHHWAGADGADGAELEI